MSPDVLCRERCESPWSLLPGELPGVPRALKGRQDSEARLGLAVAGPGPPCWALSSSSSTEGSGSGRTSSCLGPCGLSFCPKESQSQSGNPRPDVSSASLGGAEVTPNQLLPLTSQVPLSKPLKSLMPQFSHLYNGVTNSPTIEACCGNQMHSYM